MAKITVERFLDSSVAANTTDTQNTQAVPSGRSLRLKKFGGCIPYTLDGSFIALQWGSGSTWETIRCLCGSIEYVIDREFIGDGTKMFRVVRKNNGATAKNMAAWMDALVLD